jgi:hypothetical protein
MMKSFLMVIMVFSLVLAANKATKPYTFSTGAIRASEVNKNFDTIYTKFNSSIDTINKVVPRWSSMLYHCDSAWQYMNIDTIAGKVNMDTVVDLDTIYSDKAHFKRFNVDTVLGSTIFKEYTPGYLYYQHAYTLNDTNRLRIELNSFHDVIYTTCGANFTWRRLIGSTYANVFRLDSADTSFRVYGRMGIGQAPTTYRLSVNGLVSASGVTTNDRDTLTYEDTTFNDSLLENGSYISYDATARIIKAGRQITFYPGSLIGSLTASRIVTLTGIPSKFLPNKTQNFITYGYNAGTHTSIVMQVNPSTGSVFLFKPGLNSFETGLGGIDYSSVTWIK